MARAKKPVARKTPSKQKPEPIPAPRKHKVRSTKIRQTAFLAAYAMTASVTHAAKASRVSRSTHYLWFETDPKYVELFNRMQVRAAQVLVDEAVRRGVEGVEEPVYYQGEICGTVQKYSDSVLQTLLRAFDPRFKDKTELSGPGGGPIAIAPHLISLAELLSSDELHSIRARLTAQSG